MNELVCVDCGSKFEGKYNYQRCQTCRIRESRNRRKKKALKYKGNKCYLCDYNKCDRSLVFHHVEASKKDFIVSASIRYSWKRVKKELNKCVLLCRNCHGEVHAGLVEIPKGTEEECYDFEKIYCKECGKEITKGHKTRRCKDCIALKKRRVKWPELVDLLVDVKNLGYCGAGRKYGVSDNGVRRWIKQLSA